MSPESEGIYRNELLARVPNFSAFLKSFGDLELVDYGETERRWMSDYLDDFQEGRVMHVFLSGIHLGILEFYESPIGYSFSGKLPIKFSKKRTEEISISWSVDSPRNDGWKNVPFP